MAKLLFITTRNVYKYGGSMRLIKNRSKALNEDYGIETELICYISEKKVKERKEEAYFASEKIISYKRNPTDMFSKYRQFEEEIIQALKKEEYSAVVLSGSFPSNIARKIKKNFNIYVVYDSHGVWDKIKEFNKNPFNRIKYLVFKQRERFLLKFTDGALVVTDSLRKYLKKRYKWDKDSFIVPPAADSREYSFEEAKELREQWRAKLGIADDEVLFIYSGRISLQQSIADAHETFKNYIKEGGKAKFLIMTPDIKKINYDDTIVMSFSPELVSEVLFAGDIAMLLRDNVVTSKVDFPNKYLEYVKSNMFIISTPYISEVSKEIIDTATGMIIKNNSSFVGHLLMTKFSKEKPLWEDFENRKKLIEKHSFKNTLVPFAEKIKSLK